MPELPEVETICRALRNGGRGAPAILSWQMEKAEVLWNKTLATPVPAEFHQRIIDQSIVDVFRRGKFIVIQLSNDYLVVHLRMSGDLRIEEGQSEIQPHDRLIVTFYNGMRLVFNDPRKFGRVWLLRDLVILFNKLGQEPLTLTSADEFHQMLSKHKRQLKPLLMDQHFLSGMGNIYTDEALHKAGLHPLMISSEVSVDQAKRLLHTIQEVLNLGIDRNGASIDWFYRGGSFQNEFLVYGRSGHPCKICGTVIKKIVVGQRGTHFCPVCQPASPSQILNEMEG